MTQDRFYFETKGINASFLKACSFGAYAGWKYLNGPPFKSDAMAFGTAVHAAILEPDLFASNYITVPFDAPKKPTKAQLEAKEKSEKALHSIYWWENFNSKNSDRTILEPEEFETIKKIKERCLAIPAVKGALESFEKEVSFTWTNDGTDFKAKLDLVDQTNGVVIDLKTTRDASLRGFSKQLLELRYDIQLLHYCKAVNATAAYAIAVETESAEVALYDLTEIAFSDFTKNRYEMALKTAKNVIELTECPPKFPNEIVTLNLPKWALESESV